MAAPKMITLEFGTAEKPVEFNMFKKSELFGDVDIDQYWFHPDALKAQKENKPGLFRTFCDGYREICLNDYLATKSDRDQQAQTYVMARLEADTRSRGKMAIFMDAFENPKVHRIMYRDAELESMLQDDGLEPITELQFRDKLTELQLVQTFDAPTRTAYKNIATELFDGVTELFIYRPEEALLVVQDRWSKWMNAISRGKGHIDKKRAMDIHSYEAAAAFRRCYSTVWSAWLLPKLVTDHGLSAHSYLFHEYWHQQIVRVAEGEPGRYFHPFHGHCLGLHPAAGRFMKTQKGKELLGEWLRDAVPMRPLTRKEQEFLIENMPMLYSYGRLLRGYYLAFFQYYLSRNKANEEDDRYKRQSNNY